MPCLIAFSTSGWNQQRGNKGRMQRERYVDVHREPLFESRALDVEIGPDEGKLRPECGHRSVRSKDPAQQLCEAEQRRKGAIRCRVDEISDRGQRIKEKVRIKSDR